MYKYVFSVILCAITGILLNCIQSDPKPCEIDYDLTIVNNKTKPIYVKISRLNEAYASVNFEYFPSEDSINSNNSNTFKIIYKFDLDGRCSIGILSIDKIMYALDVTVLTDSTTKEYVTVPYDTLKDNIECYSCCPYEYSDTLVVE